MTKVIVDVEIDDKVLGVSVLIDFEIHPWMAIAGRMAQAVIAERSLM